jgi:hypothetical protein
MKLVGLVGKLNSGKSTVARLFTKWGFISFSSADPLKFALQDIFDIPNDVLWGPSEMRTGEVRQMLQELGTDFARKFRPNIWVEKLAGRIQSWHFLKIDPYDMYEDDICRAATGVIVPDIRFPNEADMVKEFGGTLIKIVRDPTMTNENTEALTHESETSVDLISESEFTHLIVNNGSLLDLEESVNNIVKDLFKDNVPTPRT